jgi:hypothetical protein
MQGFYAIKLSCSGKCCKNTLYYISKKKKEEEEEKKKKNPGKETRYPLYRRLKRPQGRSARMQKISPSPGFDPLTVQPVAGRYTD